MDDIYGDKTDYMGFAANILGAPHKGFVSFAQQNNSCCLHREKVA
jgi:hypothetical protein